MLDVELMLMSELPASKIVLDYIKRVLKKRESRSMLVADAVKRFQGPSFSTAVNNHFAYLLNNSSTRLLKFRHRLKIEHCECTYIPTASRAMVESWTMKIFGFVGIGSN